MRTLYEMLDYIALNFGKKTLSMTRICKEHILMIVLGVVTNIGRIPTNGVLKPHKPSIELLTTIQFETGRSRIRMEAYYLIFPTEIKHPRLKFRASTVNFRGRTTSYRG